MEWLQTYKIGDELLKTGKYEPIYAYLASYTKRVQEDNKPHILDVIIDIDDSQISFELRSFDESFSEVGINHSIFKEKLFSEGGKRFNSFYLCSRYGKETSILDFFGIEDGKIIEETKKQNKITFEKTLSSLISSCLLDNSFKESRLYKIRKKIREDDKIVTQLSLALSNLSAFVEDSSAMKKLYKELNQIHSDVLPSQLISRVKKSEIVIVVPKVIYKQTTCYLNRENEAVTFYYNRFLSLANIESANKKMGVCYFDKTDNVYTVSTPRDDINILKIFTNSPTTRSRLIGENFQLSRDSYERLKIGAWFISKQLKVRIAGVLHYVLPDFNSTFKILDYKSELTEKIDIAFRFSDYNRMNSRFNRLSSQNINSISFLGFWKDDKQIDITNRIQLVNPDHFNQVFSMFEDKRDAISDIANINKIKYSNFTLAAAYLLFPVSTNTPKKNSSLEFYKMLLEKLPVPDIFLIENFIKLANIYRYGKKDERTGKFIGTVNVPYSDPKYFDSSVSIAAIKYLILLNLTNKIYNKQHMMETEINKSGKTESFFELSGFSSSNSKKSLFYLGRLIKRIAKAQEDYGNSKAILNKINYSGMSVSDIQWLSIEVVEKLKQYNRGNYPALDLGEKDLGLFNEHFCLANSQGQDSWGLTDIENVFYLFVGYGMYWQTMDSKEKKIVGEAKEEIPEIQNENVIEEDNNEDLITKN